MFTDLQLREMFKVWHQYHNYPYWLKNTYKRMSIRYFIDQIYAWALFSSNKKIPANIVLDPILQTKTNIGQVLGWLISARTGIRLSKLMSPIPRGKMISDIQRALH